MTDEMIIQLFWNRREEAIRPLFQELSKIPWKKVTSDYMMTRRRRDIINMYHIGLDLS